MVLILLALGFPIALVLAWAFDLTSEGIKRSVDGDLPSVAQAARSAAGRRFDFVIIGLLVVAVGLLLGERYLFVDDSAPTSDTGAASGAPQNSVAILPFENLSSSPDDAYFAEGIHLELHNQLLRLRGLNVTARPSVRQYVGTTLPVEEIARQLNVAAVMTASVRYDGDRMVLSAALWDGASGRNLWLESYDRTIDRIIETQADIATEISAALEAELTPAERAALAAAPTDSPEAYALYLKATSIDVFPSSTRQPQLREVRRLLDRILTLDPKFAAALALKALRPPPGPIDSQWQSDAVELARQALTLDPSLGEPYLVLANAAITAGRWGEHMALLERALEASPNHAEVVWNTTLAYSVSGRHADAIALAQRFVALNPRVNASYNLAGNAYLNAGLLDDAVAAFAKSAELDPTFYGASMMLGLLEIARRNEAAALTHLQKTLTQFDPTAGADFLLQAAYGLSRIGQNEQSAQLIQRVEMLRAAGIELRESELLFLALLRGDETGALESLSRLADRPWSDSPLGTIRIANNIVGDPVLARPEFQAERERLRRLFD
jgi:TolB-like protein/Tfp pilus assembly protein PilF